MTIKISNRPKMAIEYVAGTKAYYMNQGTNAYVEKVRFGDNRGRATFEQKKSSLSRLTDANLFTHQWNATVNKYKTRNFITDINMEPVTYSMSFRLYNKVPGGHTHLNDSVHYDLTLLNLVANGDIANKTPGKLKYILFGSDWSVQEETYTKGYITGVQVTPRDEEGWAVDVTIDFLSVDGLWTREFTTSGDAGSASSGVYLGPDHIAFETNSPYKIKLYNTTAAQDAGFTFQLTKNSQIISVSQKCTTDEGYVVIDTLNQETYSNTKTNYIPYLSSRKDPFAEIPTAGVRYIRLKTPYQYELTIYSRTTHPVIRDLDEE